MITVSLKGIQLHAHVGLYPEEKITGNDFEIDVTLCADEDVGGHWPFLDYTIIYTIVENVFQQPADLLETCVQAIHGALRRAFPPATTIRVAVRKLHPPIKGSTVAFSEVTYEK